MDHAFYKNYLDILRNETHIIQPYYIFITNNSTLIYVLLFTMMIIFFSLLAIISKLFGATKLVLPGPIHFPIIGSLYEFIKNKNRFYNWMLDCAKKYGGQGVFYFSIPVKTPYIIIIKPEYIREVLKDNMDLYHRQPIYQVCDELLGQGIFNVDGLKWRQQRRIASHGFSTKQLNENALKCFKKCASTLKHKIALFAESNQTFDIKDLFFRTTMDSICKIAFDYDVNSTSSENMPEFAVAIDKCTKHLFNRILNPLWRIKKIISLQDELEYKNNIKKLDTLCYSIIDQRIELLKTRNAFNNISGDTQNNFMNGVDLELYDILSLFINKIIENQNEIILDDIFQDDIKKYLRDIIFSFIIAGRDTTASTLSWLFFELLTKNDLTELIKNEINLETKNYNQQSYPIIQSAFLETLRLHPPVPMDVKYAKRDLVLGENQDSAIYVPKDAAIIYSPYIMGRLESIWGPNCETFDINRSYKKTDFEFPCFNAGPRICLGKNFAIMEAKVIISKLFKHFDFVCDDKSIFNKPAQYSLGVTSSPNHQILVRAIKRNI